MSTNSSFYDHVCSSAIIHFVPKIARWYHSYAVWTIQCKSCMKDIYCPLSKTIVKDVHIIVSISSLTSDILIVASTSSNNKLLFLTPHIQVFFRAGVLGKLEEWRDDRLAEIISMIQAQIRGYLGRIEFKKMLDQKLGLGVIQRNLRKYLILRNWGWWRLYTKVRPFCQNALQYSRSTVFGHPGHVS